MGRTTGTIKEAPSENGSRRFQRCICLDIVMRKPVNFTLNLIERLIFSRHRQERLVNVYIHLGPS